GAGPGMTERRGAWLGVLQRQGSTSLPFPDALQTAGRLAAFGAGVAAAAPDPQTWSSSVRVAWIGLTDHLEHQAAGDGRSLHQPHLHLAAKTPTPAGAVADQGVGPVVVDEVFVAK